MSWGYARDQRTDEQVLKDYQFGKQNELLVFQNLPFTHKFLINQSDNFGSLQDYQPDGFIFHRGQWWPIEIKFSLVELTYVELKVNQCDRLAWIRGIYIQATPTRVSFNKTWEVAAKCEKRIGYCNKECYLINTPAWISWNKKINFIKK